MSVALFHVVKVTECATGCDDSSVKGEHDREANQCDLYILNQDVTR